MHIFWLAVFIGKVTQTWQNIHAVLKSSREVRFCHTKTLSLSLLPRETSTTGCLSTLGVGSRTPADAKIWGCLNPLYKMVQCSPPSISTALHLQVPFLFLKIILFIYLFLAVLVLRSCAVLSLDLTSGGSSLAVMCRLLIAVASLVGEHRLNS